ncbi:hypothetical protein K1719_003511 [Acacia pycnantha]|nr:hypothetical protein K1719_003511 [Acacia pycnantha]
MYQNKVASVGSVGGSCLGHRPAGGGRIIVVPKSLGGGVCRGAIVVSNVLLEHLDLEKECGSGALQRCDLRGQTLSVNSWRGCYRRADTRVAWRVEGARRLVYCLDDE